MGFISPLNFAISRILLANLQDSTTVLFFIPYGPGIVGNCPIEKGKPVERQGHKVTGLHERSFLNAHRIAELPLEWNTKSPSA